MSTLYHFDSAVLTLVTFSSAPAFWPPPADCYSSLPLLGQQQVKLQSHPAAPPAQGACPARAPATSPAQCGSQTGQGPRHGRWTRTSAPAEQLHSRQLPPHLLCRITPLRTHNHHVIFSLHGNKGIMKWDVISRWNICLLLYSKLLSPCLFLQLMMVIL